MVVYANINDVMFHIKVLEEWRGPMHWDGLSLPKDDNDSEGLLVSDEESEDSDDPPLFDNRDECIEDSEDEEEEVRDDVGGLEEGKVEVMEGRDVSQNSAGSPRGENGGENRFKCGIEWG